MPDDVIGDVIDDIIGGVSSESVGDSYGVMPSVNKLVCLRLVMVVFVWACLLWSRTLSCERHVGDLSCDPGRC